MTISLRPYQQSAIEGVRDAFRAGHRAPLLVAATGAGKTVMFGAITQSAADRGKSVMVIAHRRELIRQASRKLAETGVEHGIIAPGFTPTRHPVQVASVQTLGRRIERIAAPDLIIFDEAHHAVAGQWATVTAAFPHARILGVTATPERLDGRGPWPRDNSDRFLREHLRRLSPRSSRSCRLFPRIPCRQEWRSEWRIAKRTAQFFKLR